MSKLLKIFAAIFTLIFVAVIALILLIDPNDYKQELQDLAAEQGITLQLKGNLSWQLWPNLGIQVEQISVTPKLPSALKQNKMALRPIADIARLSASVQLLPLFSGAIAVDGIVIEKAHFYLEKDNNGRGNWELPSDAEKTQAAALAQPTATISEPNSETAATNSSLNLAISSIELRQISADYVDRTTDQQLSLQQLNIVIKQFNLEQTPFSVQLDWQTRIDDKTSNSLIDNSGELSTQMTLSQDFESYTFADTQLTTELSGQASGHTINAVTFSANDFNLNNSAFPLQLDWNLDLAEPQVNNSGKLSGQLRLPADLSLVQLSDGLLESTLTGNGETSAQQLALTLDVSLPPKDSTATTTTTVSGNIKSEPINLKQLLTVLGQTPPNTNDSKALTQISFQSHYLSDLNNLKLQQLSLQLDDTRISGSIDIKEFDSSTALPQVIARLQGDKIDVDRYLAPTPVASAEQGQAVKTADAKASATKPTVAPATTTPTQNSSAIIIPVADLQPLRLDIGVDFKQMKLKKLHFKEAKVKLSADKGLLRLQQLQAKFYKGSIKVSAQVDGRAGSKNKATLKSTGAFTNIELAPLLKDLELDQDYQIGGRLSAQFNGVSSGVTDTMIMRNLVGKAGLNSPELTLKPINIEQQYCALVQASKIQGNQAQWPKQTVISNFNGSATIKNQLLKIPAVAAEVVNLKLGARGDVNIDNGNFEIIFPLTLTKAWTSDTGCRTNEQFLIGRKLELLRAKGNLSDENPTDAIGQNPEGVRDLAKAYVQYQLQKSLADKLGLTPGSNSGEDGKAPEKVDTRDAIRGLFDSYINKKMK